MVYVLCTQGTASGFHILVVYKTAVLIKTAVNAFYLFYIKRYHFNGLYKPILMIALIKYRIRCGFT